MPKIPSDVILVQCGECSIPGGVGIGTLEQKHREADGALSSSQCTATVTTAQTIIYGTMIESKPNIVKRYSRRHVQTDKSGG